jgi:multidrug efflux pump subunit AcrA (membrane-fusion protein)
VKLSEKAAKRLGIETAAVRSRGSSEVIPYDAVLYDAGGATFTYTSPERLVFVRAPIKVTRIDGDKAILSAGPKAGTEVVTVGLQELYGSEYEVEED